MSVEHLWLLVGLAGQGLFSLRFLVQWWRSERAQRSVVPIGFWYLSLSGGVLLLFYAIHRHDPVFTLGQATGVIVYLRNLQLIHRAPQSA
ncbi:MAG TPA: lipid-A-disaccharide synthase N-terminal domain-containing protein [Gemmatimonadales bacterium]|jgi:lipid-A-disaccharide synthase-like uncharacterized protein